MISGKIDGIAHSRTFESEKYFHFSKKKRAIAISTRPSFFFFFFFCFVFFADKKSQLQFR